jgi:hypothetical protein
MSGLSWSPQKFPYDYRNFRLTSYQIIDNETTTSLLMKNVEGGKVIKEKKYRNVSDLYQNEFG